MTAMEYLTFITVLVALPGAILAIILIRDRLKAKKKPGDGPGSVGDAPADVAKL